MDYKKRIIDQLISDKLEERGAVLLEGPKACGKTTSSKMIAKSVFDFGDSAQVRRYETVIENAPALAFKDKETPILIDEWQVFPSLWDSIRHEVALSLSCHRSIETVWTLGYSCVLFALMTASILQRSGPCPVDLFGVCFPTRLLPVPFLPFA